MTGRRRKESSRFGQPTCSKRSRRETRAFRVTTSEDTSSSTPLLTSRLLRATNSGICRGRCHRSRRVTTSFAATDRAAVTQSDAKGVLHAATAVWYERRCCWEASVLAGLTLIPPVGSSDRPTTRSATRRTLNALFGDVGSRPNSLRVVDDALERDPEPARVHHQKDKAQHDPCRRKCARLLPELTKVFDHVRRPRCRAPTHPELGYP